MSITASPTEAVDESTDGCTPVLSCSLMDRDEAERIAQVLKAIADPTRLQLLRLIQAAPNEEACVCDLTDCLGLRQPTISHHLKIMMGAGLLRREKRGTWVYYAIDHEGLDAVQNILRSPVDALV